MNKRRDGMAVAFLAAALAASAFGAADGERIWDDRPGADWESTWYPLGNGRLGCMIDGGVRSLRVQFNVDSLWTGDRNLTADTGDDRADANYAAMGSYQNFGELELTFDRLPQGDPSSYMRSLSLSNAIYGDRFSIGGETVTRTAFASAPDDAIYITVHGRVAGLPSLTMRGAHGETESKDAGTVSISGSLPNGLPYAARATLAKAGPGGSVAVVVLRAATGVTDIPAEVRPPDPDAAVRRHIADYRGLYGRMSLDLGKGDARVPTRERLRRVREGASDPSLVALQFNFGRYLLISCSRPGTLPANLQGLWNNSNNPPWHCDYHTNINLQMNYWGADAANLSECFTPLSDWMLSTLPAAVAGTKAAFPGSRGYAYRTSVNAVGGGGWRWNFAGAPWLAAQCYDHWLFTRDDRYLRDVCWPLMKGAAEFMISTQLRERGDGSVVVKNGWSPEHGPREDGVAHDQQIVRELFLSILAAAKTLRIDDGFTREVARLAARLPGDRIGSWGQLQEWETDRDRKGDDHRHTSHLYAVYPGSTISRSATPALAKAAAVALDGRALTGDAHRSWTWPWRAALWARLGESEKAGEMLDSLLRYNTMDNMFTTHRPFQIDGNLGMVAAVCEILSESSIPPGWKHGSVRGLRRRDGGEATFGW